MVHMINSMILNILEFCFFTTCVFWHSYLVASKMLKCLLQQTAVNVWNSSFYCAYVFFLIELTERTNARNIWYAITCMTRSRNLEWFVLLKDLLPWDQLFLVLKSEQYLEAQNTVCDMLSICQFDVCTCMFQRIFLAFCIYKRANLPLLAYTFVFKYHHKNSGTDILLNSLSHP